MSAAVRQPYDGVVITSPVTVPYTRFSKESAHWWIARALGESVRAASLTPREIDWFSVSSFNLMPDSAVGLVQLDEQWTVMERKPN